MMLDLDHFKAVNDRLGHAAGDQVLMEVARILNDSCREIDLAARYGGEEFTIVLPATTTEQARLIAERIRAQVQERRFAADPTAGPTTHALTLSIGIAEAGLEDDLTSLISRADAALYVAKLGGRNRVHVSRSSGDIE
jgi:diguanylate cyclase (GGDEF)-like protein